MDTHYRSHRFLCFHCRLHKYLLPIVIHVHIPFWNVCLLRFKRDW